MRVRLGSLRWVPRRVPVRWLVILVLALLCFVSTFLGLDRGILMIDDAYFPFNPSLDLSVSGYAWNGVTFPGYPYYVSYSFLPFIAFVYISSSVAGLPLWTSDALWFSILESVSAVGTYALVRKILLGSPARPLTFGTELAAGMSGAIFAFNYFRMAASNGETYPSVLSLSLMPLFLLLAMRLVETKDLGGSRATQLYLVGLAMSLGIYEVPYLLWSLFLTLVFVTFACTKVCASAKSILFRLVAVTSIFVVSMTPTLGDLYYNTVIGEKALFAYQTVPGVSAVAAEYSSANQAAPLAFLQFGFSTLPDNALSPLSLGFPIHSLVMNSPALDVATFAVTIVAFSGLLLSYEELLRGKYIIFYVSTLLIVLLGTANLSMLIGTSDPLLSGLAFSSTVPWSGFAFSVLICLLVGISIEALWNRSANVAEKLRDAGINGSGSHATGRRRRGNRLWRQRSRMVFVVPCIMLLLFLAPQLMGAPDYEVWGVGQSKVTSSVFHPSSAFMDLGNFLSNNAGNSNVLMLPIEWGPSASIDNGSRYVSVINPLTSFIKGQAVYRDRELLNNDVAYPILKLFPGPSQGNFSRYLALLGISYIVVNTAADPGWSVAPAGVYAEGYPYDYEKIFGGLNQTYGLSGGPVFGNYRVFKFAYPDPLISAVNGIPSTQIGNSTVLPIDVYHAYASNLLNPANTSIIEGINSSLTGVDSTNCSLKWTTVFPGKYNVRVRCTHPFYLRLNQQFSPLWTIELNGASANVLHVEVDGFANGWLMPSGQYTVIIELSINGIQGNAVLLATLGLFAVTVVTWVSPMLAITMRKRKLENPR